MNTTTSPEEQPKKKIANRIITQKRRYFVPEHGVSVEADNSDEAVAKAVELTKKQEEEGDV